VSPKEKQAMQAALRVPSSGDRNVRLKYFDGWNTKSLSDLIDSSSMEFFKILRFDLNFFLYSDPQQWAVLETYQTMQKVVQFIKVVNDAAERKIALMSDYNDVLTKNEATKQDILQIVENNRKRISNTAKNTLANYEKLD
jgi:hypothetical protein